jgi:hypothetical protein
MEEEDAILVSRPLVERLGELLQEDGFNWSGPVFFKDLEDGWRAWFCLSGFSFDVNPIVGIYNTDLVKIANKAFAMAGHPSQQKPDTGPPLIMQYLERLIGDDEDCVKRISWHMKIDQNTMASLTSMPELQPEVANDIAYCLGKKGYPFFAAYSSFQRIQDALLNRAVFPSPAFVNYAPLILMRLGYRNEILSYVEKQASKFKNAEMAKWYREYVDALLKIVPADGTPNG